MVNFAPEWVAGFTGICSDSVYILTSNGYYWSAQSDGDLDSDRTSPYTWETFTVVNHSDSTGCLENNDSISLKSYHSTYVVAESDGSANADRTAIGSFEKITTILR